MPSISMAVALASTISMSLLTRMMPSGLLWTMSTASDSAFLRI